MLVQPVRIGRSSPPAVNAFLREDAFGIHIVASLVHQSHITGIVAYEREVVVGHLHDSRIRIGDLRFAFPVFGGDKDDSVGGSRTINSCGGSVFQYGDAFDVVGVHIVHAPFDTVHQDQWGVGIERTVTADADGGTVRTGLSRSLRDVHTGGKSRKGGRNTHDGSSFRLVGKVDGSHRTGQVHFLLYTVAHYHYFIQHFRFHFHLYIKFRTPVQEKRGGLITNVTERNGRFGRSCF